MRASFASAELFTMRSRAGRIRCPTLITRTEGDALADAADSFVGALTGPTTLLKFAAAEGADGHCEMQNRSLLDHRARRIVRPEGLLSGGLPR